MCRRCLLLLVAGLLVAVGVGACRKKDDGVLRREGEPDYVQAFDEAQMDAAIAEARARLDTFVAALDAREPGTDSFAVKKGFAYGKDGMEFIWMNEVRRKGDSFIGKVNNEPVNAVGVSLGDTVEVPRADVADWMYLSHGSLRGGYTIVALAYGSPEQAEYGESMNIDWSAYEFLQKAK